MSGEWVDLRLALSCGHDVTVRAKARSPLAHGLADQAECPECGRLSFVDRQGRAS